MIVMSDTGSSGGGPRSGEENARQLGWTIHIGKAIQARPLTSVQSSRFKVQSIGLEGLDSDLER